MRIALVWNAEARLVDLTVRHELFVRGFEALGHEVVTVCTQRAAEGYPCAVHPVAGPGDLADRALWRRLHADVAVMITWHVMADISAAIRGAGTRTIAIADSDGQVSPRVHPRATWQVMIAAQPRWDLKVRATKAWLHRRLLHGRREDLARIESTQHSDLLVFGTERAKEHFRRLLTHHGRNDLAGRLAVAPYPVNEAFCDGPIPTRKRNRVVAVARWDSPQKDAGLMAAALRIFLEQGARTEILLVGRGGEDWFGQLARDFPQVRYLGVQSREVIAALLAESRSVAFSSRWESGPIAAWEALALGGTVVGAPIPNLACLTAGQRFGRVGQTRRPTDLARAIGDEMRAWDEGRRNPLEIATHWRAKLRPAAVCQGLLDGLSAAVGGPAAAGGVPCLSRE